MNATLPLDFTYEPLDPDRREIRLLRLHPAQSSNDPVSGELITTSLDHRPRYDALSYVWGPQEPAANIRVNGLQLSIGPNLHRALVAIRQNYYQLDQLLAYRPREWYRRKFRRGFLQLWVDAVCINQVDTKEREKQVLIMRDVYTQAHVVRIWLDSKLAITRPAFKALENFKHIHAVPDLGVLKPLLRAVSDHEFYRETYIGQFFRVFWPSRTTRARRPFNEMFWRPVLEALADEYWGRLWVQQELLLASRAIIHCSGHAVISASSLFQFDHMLAVHNNGTAGNIHDRGRAVSRSTGLGYFTTFCNGRRHVARLRRTEASTDTINPSDAVKDELTRPSHLLQMFLCSAGLQFSDPRDRVYGCLGLLNKSEIALIQIDYNLDVIQTYAQVYRSFVRTTKSLDFLSYYSLDGSLERPPDNFPSWMPTPQHGSWIWREALEAYKCYPFHLIQQKLKADISLDGRNLTVKAFRIDAVQCLGRGSVCDTPIRNWIQDVADWSRDVYQLRHSTSTSTRSVPAPEHNTNFLSLFQRGLSAYWHQSFYETQLLTSERLAAALGYIIKLPAERKKPNLTLAEILDLQISRDPKWMGPAVLSMYDAVKRASFFVSNGTKEIGLIHQSNSFTNAVEGDNIYIVLGCPKPVILRRCDDDQGRNSGHFILVGSVVLPTMMDGTLAERFLADEQSRGLSLDDIIQEIRIV